MINAFEKFREGYIILKRPFDFIDLSNPLQKLTICWAISEQPVIKKEISKQALTKIEDIENKFIPFTFLTNNEKGDWLEEQVELVLNDPKNYDNLYEGEIVQTIIENKIVRLYPEEYSILTKEKVIEIMSEEGYHTICDKTLYSIKEFMDKRHYLMSRGIDKNTAEKWASIEYKQLVHYKPYYGLLTLFCRDHEIYPDKFYTEIEKIEFN